MIQDMKETFSRRKNPRLRDFDYSTAGAYFITICTENRKNLLSHIVGGDVLDAPCDIELSEYGKIAEKYVNQLSDFYKDIVVEAYTIMPNHIHIMLMIQYVGTSRTSSPTKQHSTVPRFISTLKRFCNKEYGYNIWQRSYNDHIIRDEEDYLLHLRYISENPLKWKLDELYTEE